MGATRRVICLPFLLGGLSWNVDPHVHISLWIDSKSLHFHLTFTAYYILLHDICTKDVLLHVEGPRTLTFLH